MDKDWEQFAVHFDKVHSDFLKILKSSYPALSAHAERCEGLAPFKEIVQPLAPPKG